MDEDFLEDLLLNHRLAVLESFVLKLHLELPLAAKTVSNIDESLAETLKQLDAVSTLRQQHLLSDPDYALTDPERATLADEMDEQTDYLKKQAGRICEALKQNQRPRKS